MAVEIVPLLGRSIGGDVLCFSDDVLEQIRERRRCGGRNLDSHLSALGELHGVVKHHRAILDVTLVGHGAILANVLKLYPHATPNAVRVRTWWCDEAAKTGGAPPIPSSRRGVERIAGVIAFGRFAAGAVVDADDAGEEVAQHR